MLEVGDVEAAIIAHGLGSLLWSSRRANMASAWHGHVSFVHWLVKISRPQRIVELGTENGVSYAAMCHAVAALGLPAECYAVDTWMGDAHTGRYDDSVYDSLNEFNATYYSGFSKLLRCTFDEALGSFQNNSIDLLHIDGLHTYEAVRHDYETWLPKVSKRGVILFHDIAIRTGDFGVWRLWQELRSTHPTFTFDHSAGLGVLIVGESCPSLVRDLCAVTDPQVVSRVQALFSEFSGAAYLNGLRDHQAQALTNTLSAVRRDLEQMTARLPAA